jgi:hypothetical protein
MTQSLHCSQLVVLDMSGDGCTVYVPAYHPLPEPGLGPWQSGGALTRRDMRILVVRYILRSWARHP